ncbi:hypothetical protein C8R43DRAFT_1138699 [Mycena crocata]|nr:hypothetical protein C8R43DRAFT_1138699 [Mycena crocata]
MPPLLLPIHLRGVAPHRVPRPPRRPAERNIPREILVLTCGAEVDLSPNDTSLWGSPQKWVVSILPLPLEGSPTSPTLIERPSTGCGATIHTGVVPDDLGRWRGPTAGVGRTVMPLSADYFKAKQNSLLGESPHTAACGCVTVGVGCCVCGNTLDVRKTFCAAHLAVVGASHPTYTFLADAVSPSLLPRRKNYTTNQVRERSHAPSVPRIDFGTLLRQIHDRDAQRETAS